ncbi:AAA family ATPase [Bradyrhizobium sp. Bra78]|uniref:AAA family ATPase n=1 Tax=Bradyrhizobium sp. Bra78 TaxID=2926010 RepID=UPI0021C926CC|nr:AAA family ATPase [Bradyrhizobium sp. Bra78]
MSFERLRFIGEDEDSETTAMPVRDKRSPADAIVDVAFEQAMTSALSRSLSGKAILAVVVVVPTAAWVAPCERFWRHRFGDRWHVVARDGGNRAEHKSTVGNSVIAKALAEGRPVVGIATSTSVLPSTLIASMDQTINLATPTGGTLKKVIERQLGRAVAFPVPSLVGIGLDIDELAATFRPGSTSRQIVSRMERATTRKIGSDDDDRLPSLETALEFGAARSWALDLAQDLEDYRQLKIDFSQVSRSLIVFGESGTGKTIFARMVSRFLGLPLLAFSIADLFANSDGMLGGVVQATNAMFERAYASKSCVLFLDELDALPDRATLSPRGRDWWLPVVANFLVKLDGAFSRGGQTRSGAGRGDEIVFIGATNYVERIDSALLRPGRYERCIEISRPDLAGTINILAHYLPEIEDADRAELGRLLRGSTGAELMMVARDARRIARREARGLEVEDVRAVALPNEAIPSVRLRRICIHEAAHAVGSLALDCGTLIGIVIQTRVGEAARTQIAYDNDDMPTRRDFECRVVAALCGRAAERLLIGEVSVGSGLSDQSDMAMATRLIGSLHTTGLAGELAFTADQGHALEAVSRDRTLRRRVEADLVRLEKEAERLVKRNRHAILAIADALAESRYLSGEAVRQIFDSTKRPYRSKP